MEVTYTYFRPYAEKALMDYFKRYRLKRVNVYTAILSVFSIAFICLSVFMDRQRSMNLFLAIVLFMVCVFLHLVTRKDRNALIAALPEDKEDFVIAFYPDRFETGTGETRQIYMNTQVKPVAVEMDELFYISTAHGLIYVIGKNQTSLPPEQISAFLRQNWKDFFVSEISEVSAEIKDAAVLSKDEEGTDIENGK